QAMLALPPVAPQVGWRNSTRLARDHDIRLDSNDYSVHPAVIVRRIEVVADLDRVKVFWTARPSPITNACGPGIRPSPNPNIVRRRTCFATTESVRCDRCANTTSWRSNSAPWLITTPRWVSISAKAGWCHDDQNHPGQDCCGFIDQPRPDR